MMTMYNPEFLIVKREEAEKKIGRRLLLLLSFKNGVLFANYYNQNQNKPSQWITFVNPSTLVGGIGNLRDFKLMQGNLCNFCQESSNLLASHYITGAGVVKFLSGTLTAVFEARAEACAVNFLVSSWTSEKGPDFWFINFDGDIKQLKNFAVAGGYGYTRFLTDEEMAGFATDQKAVFEKQRKEMERVGMPFAPHSFVFPQKDTIIFLEKKWKSNLSKDAAVNLAKETLIKCNPSLTLENSIIEINVFVDKKQPNVILYKPE